MRVGLPLMLLISVALHLGVVGEALFVHFRSLSAHVAVQVEDVQPSLTLVPAMIQVDALRSMSIKPATSSGNLGNPILTGTKIQVSTNAPVAAAAPSTVSLEAHVHVAIRPPTFEAALSPSPAPSVNHWEGIVFLLDVSGSMYEPYAGTTRLALAREALTQRIRTLKDGTPFAITVYGQTARNSGPLVPANDTTRAAAVRYINEDYDCGGGTNLPAGMAMAQDLRAGEIILVSDGDLNITPVDLLAHAHRILSPSDKGPTLVVLAISPRPGTNATELLHGLADQQGGSCLVEEAGTTDATQLLTSNKTEVAAP